VCLFQGDLGDLGDGEFEEDELQGWEEYDSEDEEDMWEGTDEEEDEDPTVDMEVEKLVRVRRGLKMDNSLAGVAIRWPWNVVGKGFAHLGSPPSEPFLPSTVESMPANSHTRPLSKLECADSEFFLPSFCVGVV
jgi:hypothetical protein